MTVRRYPLAPLAARLHIQLSATGPAGGNEHDSGLAALAVHLGISHRTAQRWHQHGLTEQQADQAAITLGVHPASIWSDWWNLPRLSGRCHCTRAEQAGLPGGRCDRCGRRP